MKKFFAVAALALAFVASAFASQKPTVTDFKMVPGGPFTRTGVAPYNFLFSPSTISREGSIVAVMVEAIPTDGTSIRYAVYGFNCDTTQYTYETYDESTDTWSEMSDVKDITPNTANSYLKPLICQ
jgi:hypothetical protein